MTTRLAKAHRSKKRAKELFKHANPASAKAVKEILDALSVESTMELPRICVDDRGTAGLFLAATGAYLDLEVKVVSGGEPPTTRLMVNHLFMAHQDDGEEIEEPHIPGRIPYRLAAILRGRDLLK